MAEYLFGTGRIDSGLESASKNFSAQLSHFNLEKQQSLDNCRSDIFDELVFQKNASYLFTPLDAIDMLSIRLRTYYSENPAKTLAECHPVEAMAELERQGYTLGEIRNNPSIHAFQRQYYAHAEEYLRSKY